MKFEKLKTNNGGSSNPCDMVSNYLLFEAGGNGTLLDWLQGFEFDSRDEITKAVRTFIKAVTEDDFMRKKGLELVNPLAAIIYKRYLRIALDASKLDKYPVSLSGEIWHGGFSRRRLEKRTAALFSKHTPDAKVFAETCQRLQRIYNLSTLDVEKLHFFVEQVKAGADFPNSLRRMLYIWGVEKQTGKTSTGTALTCLLNGDTNTKNIAQYSTTLSNEMQIKSFAVPKISECNVCLMDECFYNDMGKTYADFKRFITSSNGRARLPFGQEFEWYGQPNYIATSNDSLQKFIKDWGDRRYLAVEFKSRPTEVLTLAQISELWESFVFNSQNNRDWYEWARELADASNEKGDRQEIADELEIELQQYAFLNFLIERNRAGVGKFSAENRVSLKFFVDWFAESMGNMEAHKRRGEIENAVLKVYGPRYSSTNYWLVSDIAKRAEDIKAKMSDRSDDPADEIETNDPLPF